MIIISAIAISRFQRLKTFCALSPRALPWAFTFRAVGASDSYAMGYRSFAAPRLGTRFTIKCCHREPVSHHRQLLLHTGTFEVILCARHIPVDLGLQFVNRAKLP